MPIAVGLALAACVVIDTAEQLSYSLVGRKPHRRAAWMALGVGLHLASLLIWLWLLTMMPLGRALLLRGSGYITIALAGWLVLDERVDAFSWMGIGLIVLGIACIFHLP